MSSVPTSQPIGMTIPPSLDWSKMSPEEQATMVEICDRYRAQANGTVLSTTTTNLSNVQSLPSTPGVFSQAAINRKVEETQPEYANFLQQQQQQQLPFHFPPSLLQSQPQHQIPAFVQPQPQFQSQLQPQLQPQQQPVSNQPSQLQQPQQPIQISPYLQAILSPKQQRQLFQASSQQDSPQHVPSSQSNQQNQSQQPATPTVPGHFPSPAQGPGSQPSAQIPGPPPVLPSAAFTAPAAQSQPQPNASDIISFMSNYRPAVPPKSNRRQLLADNDAMIIAASEAWKQSAHHMVEAEAILRRLTIERRDLMHKGLVEGEGEDDDDDALPASPSAGRAGSKKKNRMSKADKRAAAQFRT